MKWEYRQWRFLRNKNIKFHNYKTKTKPSKIFAPSFIIAAAIILVLFSKRNLVFAQSPYTFLEAEVGTLFNGATVISDQNASQGKYIHLGSPTNGSTFQPTAPYYATFYYEWYKNPTTDGSWSYWSDQGNNPPTTWFSKYLPDPLPNSFDPSKELYSTNDYTNFKWQVAKMAEAHIEVAIASWFGQSTKEDTAFNNIVNNFMGRLDNPYPNLRWAMYYENEGFADPSVSTIVSDLSYIKTKYSTSPYFLKVNSKPVIFVYADANDGGGMTQRWKVANTQMGNYFYIVLKVFPGYANDPNQPDSWHQYAPATRSGTHSPYSSYVSPGFWLDDGSAERLPRDPTSFESAVQNMVSSNVTWKLIETWNEWGEGTSVEPGTPAVPEVSNYTFGNLYINILNRNLPALEAGTGSQTVGPTTNPTATSTPVSTSDPVVVADGDISCGVGSTGAACKQKETSDLVMNINPTAVLVLGDNQYEEGTLSDFQNFYNLTWGRFKNITYPAVGNHEYLTTNAAGYFDYFNGVGNQTGAAGDRSKGYYAFNLGSWRLYALNSNCTPAGGCGVGSPQEVWLKADLTANPHKCVLAYYHHPLYSSGSRTTTSVKPLFQDLYDYGAEIVLSGHEHNYERFAPQDANGNPDNTNGVREFVVGTGGRNFTQFVTNAPNSEVKNDTTFGVLKLVLHNNSYDFQFVPIPGSSFTDNGSNVPCH